jgi:hypothetical protein
MAVAINHSDPGAVPGASTQAHRSKRVSVKDVFFPGMVPPLSGYAIVANDNYAPVAQAA